MVWFTQWFGFRTFDIGHCLKSELFDNRTIIDAPKTERIWISALYCTLYKLFGNNQIHGKRSTLRSET